jgi:hypothetical protein
VELVDCWMWEDKGDADGNCGLEQRAKCEPVGENEWECTVTHTVSIYCTRHVCSDTDPNNPGPGPGS